MNKDPNLKPIEKGYVSIPLDHISKGLILEIYEKSNVSENTLFEKIHAIEFNQSNIQIIEGKSYDIELKYNDQRECDYYLPNNSFIRHNSSHKNLGILAPNFYVGTLSLPICKIDTTLEISATDIEVRSDKTDYESQYQIMLEDIAYYCIDLLLQVEAPIHQSFESDFKQIDDRAIYQKFIFIKSLIDSKEFDESVQKIISNPSTKWELEIQERDIRNIKRFTSRNIRELVSKPNRVNISTKIGNLTSVPLKITSSRKIESIDTPENRFIKHAISTFLDFAEDCERRLIDYPNESNDAKRVVEKLNNILNQNFFTNISRPNSLKLNSPVLQRRSGYREILNAWLKFDLAAKLVWEGGDEIFSGGKKNIAALYEYWLFFVLLDIIKTQFKITTKEEGILINSLITPDKNGLGLNLVSGKQKSLFGTYEQGRKYTICFSFNKTFSTSLDYNDKKQGSWTIPFRPDYTLSIWPNNLTEKDAEKNESIVHIHFDSKYKIKLKGFEAVKENIDGKNEDEVKKEIELALNQEKESERQDTFKNADLWKMHAYKDAIRRTGGAYILYPGESNNSPRFSGFHEILPGLGAFAIMPRKDRLKQSNDYPDLVKFIKELIEHFDNRLTQRERLSANIGKIFENKPLISNINIPEYIDLSNNVKLIPSETFILVGYYRSSNHLDWVLKNSKYNIRIGDKENIITKEMISAKYLLLFSEQKNECIFFNITSDTPLIYTKQHLINLMYHEEVSPPTQENYLIFEIKKGNATQLDELNIDKHVLKNNKAGFEGTKADAIPFALSFEDLLKCLKD